MNNKNDLYAKFKRKNTRCYFCSKVLPYKKRKLSSITDPTKDASQNIEYSDLCVRCHKCKNAKASIQHDDNSINTSISSDSTNLFARLKQVHHTCFYCGKFITDSEKTIDHLTPKSRGGTNTDENLAVTCFCCNSKKNNMTLEEYVHLVLYNKDIRPKALVARRVSSVKNKKLNNLLKSKYCTCFYCGKTIRNSSKFTTLLTPREKGGKVNEDNAVISCFNCTYDKGNKTLDEFIDYVFTKHKTKKFWQDSLDYQLQKHNIQALNVKRCILSVDDIVLPVVNKKQKPHKKDMEQHIFNVIGELSNDIFVIPYNDKYILLAGLIRFNYGKDNLNLKEVKATIITPSNNDIIDKLLNTPN